MSEEQINPTIGTPLAQVREFSTRTKDYAGLSIFLIFLGLLFPLIFSYSDLRNGSSFKEILQSAAFGIAIASPVFLLSLYYFDLQSRKYLLRGMDLCFVHPRFPFLNKTYDLRSFNEFRLVQGRGCKVLYLYQRCGFAISIPILGTIPDLINAIDSVHSMTEK